MRDELRESFYGPQLWMRAANIRRRTNTKYNQADIVKLQLEFTGVAQAQKKNKKTKGKKAPPVSHNSMAKGSVAIGRSTIAKHYKVTGRAERFEATQEAKIRAHPDREYAPARGMVCS